MGAWPAPGWNGAQSDVTVLTQPMGREVKFAFCELSKPPCCVVYDCGVAAAKQYQLDC